MSLRKILLPLGTWLVANAFGQSAPTLEWQLCIGGSDPDYGTHVTTLPDGGYAIGGTTLSSDGDVSGFHGDNDIWAMKVTASGQLEWERAIGGSDFEEGTCLTSTSDGGFLVGGYTYSNDGDIIMLNGSSDALLTKFSATGEVEWIKTVGGPSDEAAFAIQQTSDGGYIMGGVILTDTTWFDLWIAKLDATGEIQWEQSAGGSDDDRAFSVLETTDGGYLAAGVSSSIDGDVTNNHGGSDVWLVKVDGSGNMQWEKSFGGSGGDETRSIVRTDDGGYLFAGKTNSSNGDVSSYHGGGDVWVVKLDGTGDLEWERCYGGSSLDNARQVIRSGSSGYILSGGTYSVNGDVSFNHGNGDAWLIELDGTGDVIWEKTFGGTGLDFGHALSTTISGGLVLAGVTMSNDGDVSGNHGAQDCWVVGLEPGSVGLHEHVGTPLQLWPNPSSDLVRIAGYALHPGALVLLSDMLGRVRSTQVVHGSSCTFDVSASPPGVYELTVLSASERTTVRLVVE